MLVTKRQNLTRSELKAFTGEKLNINIMMISVFDRVDNIVGKGENAGTQHFLLFQKCFLPYQRRYFSYGSQLKCRLEMLSSLHFSRVPKSHQVVSFGMCLI